MSHLKDSAFLTGTLKCHPRLGAQVLEHILLTQSQYCHQLHEAGT